MVGVEIASSLLKIGRGEEHLGTLKREIIEWVESKPYSVAKKCDAEGRRHSMVATLLKRPPVDRWSLLSGDCIFNLRSALDHMVYGIAIRESGKAVPPGEQNLQFPIADTPEKFWGKPMLSGVLKGGAVERIKTLSARIQAAIERVQPYHRPADVFPASLTLLRDLSNADKHRLLHVMVSHPAGGKISMVGGEDFSAREIWFNPAGIEDQAEIAWFVLTNRDPKANYKYQFTFLISFDMRIGSAKDPPQVITILERMLKETRAIINGIGMIG